MLHISTPIAAPQRIVATFISHFEVMAAERTTHKSAEPEQSETRKPTLNELLIERRNRQLISAYREYQLSSGSADDLNRLLTVVDGLIRKKLLPREELHSTFGRDENEFAQNVLVGVWHDIAKAPTRAEEFPAWLYKRVKTGKMRFNTKFCEARDKFVPWFREGSDGKEIEAEEPYRQRAFKSGRAPDVPWDLLDQDETFVLSMRLSGHTQAEIAHKMDVHEQTVKNISARIRQKGQDHQAGHLHVAS